MEFLFGIVWLVLAFVLARAAKKKGRSFGGFLALGIFLSPIVSLIALLILGENKKRVETVETIGEDKKTWEEQKKERLEHEKKVEDAITAVFESAPGFEGGKLFHCSSGHAVAFSKTGDVLIIRDGNTRQTTVNDISGIKYEKEKDNVWDFLYERCVISINDFDNPIVKIDLSKNAKDMCEEIKATYNFLKKENSGK
jgi:hypothetical protein